MTLENPLQNDKAVWISRKQYPHDLYKLHKEKTLGNFSIRKLIIPKGTYERFFDQKLGIIQCYHVDSYPIVQVLQDGSALMTDTPYEVETNRKAIQLAQGDILDCGLGIGYFPYYASKKKRVESITIVEKEQGIIDLVYPLIKNEKTQIICTDAKKFLKTNKKKFDMIHIDFEGGMLPIKSIDSLRELAQRNLKSNGKIIIWQEDLWEIVKKNIKKGKRDSVGVVLNGDPCMCCGKTTYVDYGRICMDCSDELGISNFKQKNKWW